MAWETYFTGVTFVINILVKTRNEKNKQCVIKYCSNSPGGFLLIDVKSLHLRYNYAPFCQMLARFLLTPWLVLHMRHHNLLIPFL
jgi:hypothetical protein